MTHPTTQPTLLARLDALYATVALNPGMAEASQGSKWRAVIEVMIEMVQRLVTLEERAAWETDRNDHNLEVVMSAMKGLDKRIKELEAWKESMTGDGK